MITFRLQEIIKFLQNALIIKYLRKHVLVYDKVKCGEVKEHPKSGQLR